MSNDTIMKIHWTYTTAAAIIDRIIWMWIRKRMCKVYTKFLGGVTNIMLHSNLRIFYYSFTCVHDDLMVVDKDPDEEDIFYVQPDRTNQNINLL